MTAGRSLQIMNFSDRINQSFYQETKPECSSCKSYNHILNFLVGTSFGFICLVALIVIVLAGYIIRRAYKKRQMADDKVFDFEQATQEMVAEKIITEDLANNDNFQLGDLLYHAHRINIIGHNTYASQWTMHSDPPEDMASVINIAEYSEFIQEFNLLARWKMSEHILLLILAITCYPMYWVLQTIFKKKKYKRIKEFINTNQNQKKFWKNMQIENYLYAKIKITKSADYTLLYLDVFNYKNSDTKYIFLNCPYIIYLSGEGNFLRPFYICESDTFLVSLFFTVNKIKDIKEENRYNIMENLVDLQERTVNCKNIHRFMKQFNRISMTLDYGCSGQEFYKNTVRLHDFILKWNKTFFGTFNLKIDLLLLHTQYNDNYNQQTITVLENQDQKKFQKFMIDIHTHVNYDNADVKFGIFIYNTLQDPDEIELAIYNQKMSFNQQLEHSNSSIPITIHESIEFDPQSLKEQFIQKDLTSAYSNYSQQSLSNIKESKDNRPSKIIISSLYIWRYINRLRYLLMSHKFTSMNKVKITMILCVFIFLDDMLSVIIFAGLDLTKFSAFQFILIPYQFAILLSPITGTLWLSSQSYGFLKVYLILNAMSLFNLSLNIIILSFGNIDGNPNYFLMALEVLDFIIKLIIIFGGTRTISMNTKLNKLSQKT